MLILKNKKKKNKAKCYGLEIPKPVSYKHVGKIYLTSLKMT